MNNEEGPKRKDNSFSYGQHPRKRFSERIQERYFINRSPPKINTSFLNHQNRKQNTISKYLLII